GRGRRRRAGGLEDEAVSDHERCCSPGLDWTVERVRHDGTVKRARREEGCLRVGAGHGVDRRLAEAGPRRPVDTLHGGGVVYFEAAVLKRCLADVVEGLIEERDGDPAVAALEIGR